MGLTRAGCWRRWTLLPLIGCLLLSGFAAASDQDQLRALKRKIGQLEQQLGKTRSQRGQAEKELAKLEPALGRLHQQIRGLNRELAAGQKELQTLSQRQRELGQQRQRQRGQLDELLRNSYLNGQESWLKLLLNQQDPAQVSRNLIYYDYLARARSEQIERYSRTLTELEQVEGQLRAGQLTLNQQKNKLQQQRAQLDERQRRRKTILAQLNSKLKKQGQSLSSMRAQRDELEQVMATVANIDLGITGQPFGKSRGKLPWPVKGKVLARYGQKHSGVPLKGLLIGAPAGTPIKSIHHGQVVFANWLRGYGLVLIVDHGNDYLSLYAHNQSLAKTVGDWVQPGDALARVGDTGGSGQSALYFEMRRKGRPYNPQPWLSRR